MPPIKTTRRRERQKTNNRSKTKSSQNRGRNPFKDTGNSSNAGSVKVRKRHQPKDAVELSKNGRRSKKKTSSPSSGGLFNFPKVETTPQERARRDARLKKEAKHLRNLESSYDIFDNPGGGGTDGKISKNDIEKVASGEYNREKAEERLRNSGVPESKIQERLKSAEETASYLLENENFRERLDTAADKSGEVDNEIARGDLDRALTKVERRERKGKVKALEEKAEQPLSKEHLARAQQAMDRWSEPGALKKELKGRPLSEFSEAELDALAAVNQNNPDNQKLIESAVLKSVEGADSLGDLPQGESYNRLLTQHITAREIDLNDPKNAKNKTAVAQRQLKGLVKEEVEGLLDERLHRRRGDNQLDAALDRFGGQLEDLAIDNPALVNIIQKQVDETVQDYSDEFTDIARADDSKLSKVGHAVTDTFREGVGFVTDGFRDAVSLGSKITNAPLRLAGKGVNLALDTGGRVAGAGLDAVGAEGAADAVRTTTDKAGDLADKGANFIADQKEGFTNGAAESLAGAVDGVAYTVTDPIGTAKGLGKIAQDPSLLLEGYKETAKEHGAAGAAGHVAGDVVTTFLTGGSGAAARGAGWAGKLSNIGGKSRFGRLAARGGARAEKVLGAIADGPGALSNKVANRAGSRGGRFGDVVEAGARRAEGTFKSLDQTRTNFRRDIKDVFQEGKERIKDLPGAERVGKTFEGLNNQAARGRFKLRREFHKGIQNLTDRPAFARVADALSPVRDGLKRADEAIRGSDAGRFRRKGDDLLAANPQLIDEITKVKEGLGRNGIDRNDPVALANFIDDNLGLAHRLDELSSGSLPSHVGTPLLEGRVRVLEYLQETLLDGKNRFVPKDVHKIIRGALVDSDPAGKVYLTKLDGNTPIFRAYDSDKFAYGGYYSRVQDRYLTSQQLVADNALPTNTKADRGVILTPAAGELAVVSRVGRQFDDATFVGGAPGGGRQLQFPRTKLLEDSLGKINDLNGPSPAAPLPVFRANPKMRPEGHTSDLPVETPDSFTLEQEEERMNRFDFEI